MLHCTRFFIRKTVKNRLIPMGIMYFPVAKAEGFSQNRLA
jgi:hypothetical protein